MPASIAVGCRSTPPSHAVHRLMAPPYPTTAPPKDGFRAVTTCRATDDSRSPDGHHERMTELELTRTPDDRRLYALEGFGTLRLIGFWSRSAVATSGSRTWQLTGTGILRRFVHATDEGGTEVGAFEPRRIHRGGELRWGDRDYVLRPSSAGASGTCWPTATASWRSWTARAGASDPSRSRSHDSADRPGAAAVRGLRRPRPGGGRLRRRQRRRRRGDERRLLTRRRNGERVFWNRLSISAPPVRRMSDHPTRRTP